MIKEKEIRRRIMHCYDVIKFCEFIEEIEGGGWELGMGSWIGQMMVNGEGEM